MILPTTRTTDPYAAPRVPAGTPLLIRGTVKEHQPGVGYLVELFSKTDQYEAWVREDQVAHVVPVPVVPPEPADETRWLGSDGATYERHDGWRATRGEQCWYNTNSGGPDTWVTVWRQAQPSQPLLSVPVSPAEHVEESR